MTAARGDARTRLPREPYPGLRPFLDFEAALLFGRERQVREVIEHLRQSQFVAVLGGSGSGKSSLIMAGVVPELRSFGIAGAGDLWLPMTCTPGTNVSADDIAARRVSPVTRLARRFAGLLKSRGSPEADTQRLQEIAEVFRQEAGFARLLDTYGGELDVPPGPDPDEARVLVVVDQFEEVFHPTNKGVEDATLLVERVLDHFFNPHPRCHVVLTMRSEHLNDCASFLELPDAINKSSYLVRRLDDDELRDAIVGPAQRFLRLMARSQPPELAASLPPEVRFEPAVLQRLLRDVKAITHDPDHLPLLQHLLARLWGAALEREEMDVPVPSHITEIDLVRAVAGGRAAMAGDEQPLDEKTNTLRACVENWPETLYQWQGEKQRAQLDALFSRLAFKDPNTGMYSQQRVDLDAMAALLGPGRTRVDLRALLDEGFLGSVDYLYWDDEDPARATLKVSHESFIRGWSRFRALVDRESERFDEFVGVLRRCSAWVSARRSEDLLLESGEMRLLRESDFEARLRAPGQHAAWFGLLKMHREGPRLAGRVTDLDAYLKLSSERLQSRDAATRQRRIWAWASVGTLVLVPPAFFSAYVQGPVTQRTELLLSAGMLANGALPRPEYLGVGGAAPPLRALLRAAEGVDEARSGRSSRMTRFSQWLLDRFSWIPQVRRQGDFLDGMAALTEPPVNSHLRQLLSTAVWDAPPRAADAASAAAGDAPPQLSAASCAGPTVEGEVRRVEGRLLVAAGAGGAGLPPRALFLPNVAGRQETTLHSALVDASGGNCQVGEVVLSVPSYQDPHLAVDSGLRLVLFSTGGEYVDLPAVTVLELDWQRLGDSSGRAVQATRRAVVTGGAAVQQFTSRVGRTRLAALESWRMPGGRALDLGAQPWRLVSASVQRLPVAVGDPRLEPLAPAAAGSACERLAARLTLPAGYRGEMLVHDGQPYCFHVARGNPVDIGGPRAAPRERVALAVYARPKGGRAVAADESPPAPLANIEQFGRLGPADRQWLVGTRGELAGWLAVRGPDAAGVDRLQGLPWSTCALWRLGVQLLPAAAVTGGEVPADICTDR